MQRKEVIDLGQYRVAPEIGADDPDGLADCALRTGTELLHGQYTLTGFLAAGGFGMTYVAKDSLSRTVVIKECFPTELCVRVGAKVTARSAGYAGGYQTLLEQFVAEAHCLAKLEHRNIVRVHQVFKENGTAYMAMDYVDGVDLCHIIDVRDRQSLPPKEIVRITGKILQAIRYVHASGMLHLDISPDNILIDRTGEPVLIDFGAARTRVTPNDAGAWPLGCVKDGYSPPEFYVVDRERGAWSDLYSLGASLYHVMSGDAPPSGEERGEARADGDADPYRPLDLTGYSAAFLKGIDRSLQFDPQRRFQTADEWIKLIDDPAKLGKVAGPKPALNKTRQGAHRTGPEAALSEPAVRSIFVPPEVQPSKTTRPVAWGVIAAAVVVGLGLSGSVIAMLPGASDAEAPLVAELAPAQVTANPVQVVDTPAVAQVAPVADIAPVLDAEAPAPVVDTAALAGISAVDQQILRALAALDAETAAVRPRVQALNVAQTQPAVPSVPASVAVIEPVSLDHRGVTAPVVAPVADSVPVNAIDSAPVLAPLSIETAVLNTAPTEAAPTVRVAGITRPGLPTAIIAPILAARPDAAPRAVAPVVPALAPKAPMTDPVAYAHWDVDMPFETTIEQVRNATTATITQVTTTTDLDVAGAWIRENTVIYALNGAPLVPDTALSTLLLNNLQVDPDGFTRASVQYRDPELGVIDRGLLAARVVRRVGLVDGTELDLGVRDLEWQARVREPGTWSGNTLQTGDIILQASAVGTRIESFEDLSSALERTLDRGVTSVELQVLRAGQIVSARLPLAQEDAS